MPRDAIPLIIPDLAAFARRLREGLAQDGPPLGHLRLLGHLARAGGFDNWQHLRAARDPVVPGPVAPALPLNEAQVARALRVFDAEGRMTRWPSGHALQGLCLWALWARLPARRDLSEAEVDAVLRDGSTFGDHVLLRRSLVDHRLAARTPGGAIYRRVEGAPSLEARAVIARVPRRAG